MPLHVTLNTLVQEHLFKYIVTSFKSLSCSSVPQKPSSSHLAADLFKMNGFFYIPLKPWKLPGPEPVPPPDIHAAQHLFQRRSSYPWGQDYRVVGVAEFRDRLSSTRQELKVRRCISLPTNEGVVRAIKRPPSAHTILGSEYSVTNFGENRVYNASKVQVCVHFDVLYDNYALF